MENRLRLFDKTVLRSLSWGMSTLRGDSFVKRLDSAQKCMVRKMMKLKRIPFAEGGLESWLDWTKRTLDRAGKAIVQHGTLSSSHVVSEQIKWAQHCARFGLEDKPAHLLKPLLIFRCQRWWNLQKFYNDVNWDPVFHATRGRPYSWEDRLRVDWASAWTTSQFLASVGRLSLS